MWTEGEDVTHEGEYLAAMDELNVEVKKPKRERNHATLKHLMETTRQQRRKWIIGERPLVSQILEKYPVLASSKQVSCLFRILHAYVCQ